MVVMQLRQSSITWALYFVATIHLIFLADITKSWQQPPPMSRQNQLAQNWHGNIRHHKDESTFLQEQHQSPSCVPGLGCAGAAILVSLLLAPQLAFAAATSPAGLIGDNDDSIVFNFMDEIPPIEDSVMYGSSTTIIKLREVHIQNCKISSAFGDVLEIHYVAKRLAPPATVYDASIYRGTGQPFKFVLGSGVMIPGVDQGLYDMCPGEVRKLKVPPKLAVGLLDPPAKAPLEWTIELVSIDGVIRQDNNDELTREERE